MCRIPTEVILSEMCGESATYADLIKHRNELQKEIRRIEKKIIHISGNIVVAEEPDNEFVTTADISLESEYMKNLYLLSKVVEEIHDRLCDDRIKFATHVL